MQFWDADAERYLREVEDSLGRKLDAELQAEAIRRGRRGEAAPAVAQWFEKLRVAADSLNDPSIPVMQDPPTRPQDDDPAEF